MITTLPNPKDVRDLYLDLMGRDVEVRVIDSWSPGPADHACVAEFVNDQLRLEAVALLDLPLAVYSGACIGLLPAGGAQDMVDEKSPSDMVVTNLYEVLNILSSVFNTPGNPHVRITTLHEPGAIFPADVNAVLAHQANRLDIETSIAGYGVGRLGLIAA